MPLTLPSVHHCTTQYANNRIEVSHQPARQREGHMRHCKSARQVQQFLSVHSPINNLFGVSRHLIKAAHYRLFWKQAFTTWRGVTTELEQITMLCSASLPSLRRAGFQPAWRPGWPPSQAGSPPGGEPLPGRLVPALVFPDERGLARLQLIVKRSRRPMTSAYCPGGGRLAVPVSY